MHFSETMSSRKYNRTVNFKISNHLYQTRNNTKMLKLPVIKTEYARKSFYFSAASIYNALTATRIARSN